MNELVHAHVGLSLQLCPLGRQRRPAPPPPAGAEDGKRREKAARSAVSAARRAAHLAAPVPPEPASEVGARRPAGRPPLPSRPGVSELLGRTARTGAGQAPAARTVACSPLGWQHLGTGHRCRGHRGAVWLDGVSGDRPSPLNACCDRGRRRSGRSTGQQPDLWAGAHRADAPGPEGSSDPEWTHDPPPGAATLFPRRASFAGVFSKQSKETPGQFFPQTRVCCQRIRNS